VAGETLTIVVGDVERVVVAVGRVVAELVVKETSDRDSGN
jgi:hypothetical protein